MPGNSEIGKDQTDFNRGMKVEAGKYDLQSHELNEGGKATEHH